MLEWLGSLFSAPTLTQIDTLEDKAPSFEVRLERIYKNCVGVKDRSDEEKSELLRDIDAALSILEHAIELAGRTDLEQRALRVRTRLRRTRTNVLKLQEAS